MKKTRKTKIKKRTIKGNYLLYSFLLVLFMVSIPLLRVFTDKNLLMSQEPYYHIRASNFISNYIQNIKFSDPGNFNPQNFNDPLIYGTRKIFINPFHFLLAASSKLINTSQAYQLLLLLLAFITVYFTYKILMNFGINNRKNFFILLFLITSPLFIYLLTISALNAMAIALSLCGFYFYMGSTYTGSDNKISDKPIGLKGNSEKHTLKRLQDKSKIFSYLCFLFASLFSIFNAVFIILVLLAYTMTFKKTKKSLLIMSLVLLLASFAGGSRFIYNFDYKIFSTGFLSNLISGLGSFVGFSIISLLFAFFGFTKTWKHKKKLVYIYLLMLLLFVVSYFNNSIINLYLNFFIVAFAGIGFYEFLNSKWEINFLKKLSILTIICIIFFSGFSYIGMIKEDSPSQDSAALLLIFDYITDQKTSKPSGYILSDIKNSFLIQTITDMPVLIDPLSAQSKDFDSITGDINALFYSTNLKKTVDLMKEYEISYIFLDNEMKHRLWENEKKQLLLLLTNSETFKKEHSIGNSELYSLIK